MPLSAGDKLGPYVILAPIGAGGMGEVYRARDPRLGRNVAIKVVPQEFITRFDREAKAIAALNHPHICTLHDIGTNYLVMEYVEGTSLQGPLPPERALVYAVQICDALDAAHRRGITHRDLKPANILVTARGVKVLDFGLAKIALEKSDAPAPDAATLTRLTQTGSILGTAAYMSPEQAKGEEVDARSDIFSFGLVLYEMLSGRQAFARNSVVETMAAVVRDEPELLDASPSLSAIVTRCLRKSPASRFQTIDEVRAALEQAATSPAVDALSIAVLPFTNIGGDKENEYFSEGLAEEILNTLSQIEGLRVAARTSSFSFKGKGAELSEIAAKLRVANVLEGSVRRAGNRIRVTVQLVDVRNGFQLWSERYDRQMEDVFDVQDDIARAIAERFKVTLSGGVKRSTNNLEAYELYLKGRYHWHQRSPAAVRLAIQCFEETIEMDPQYALAYAGLADCYGILRAYGWVSADAQPQAHAAMTRAMSLAPELWQVNFSRAFFMLFFEREWRNAGRYFQKAIAINPRSSLAHAYYGLFLVLDAREEAGVSHLTRACQLDPLSPFIHGISSLAYFRLGCFDASERAAQQALDLQPGYLLALWSYGRALSGLGRHQEAIEALERAVTLSRTAVFVGALGLVYARAGRPQDASRLLCELEDRGSRGEYIPPFARLAIHVGQGDVATIRRMLSETLEESTGPASLILSGPFLEAFRSDPEIHRMLVERYGR
jgi:serine/threonine-protein kinase